MRPPVTATDSENTDKNKISNKNNNSDKSFQDRDDIRTNNLNIEKYSSVGKEREKKSKYINEVNSLIA